MTRTLSVGDVQATHELMAAIAVDFSKLANAAVDNKEMQLALDAAWQKVQMLERINIKLDVIVAGAQAALDEMARQRNIAVHDVGTWRKHGDELARRILAGRIAVDGKIPVTDVMRVLDVLAGKMTTLEEPRLATLYEVIRNVAESLFEEQVWDAASRED